MTLDRDLVTHWIWRGILIVAAVLAIAAYFSYSSAKQDCAALCQENKAVTFQLLASGSFTAPDDCICYYENSMKTFTLG